MVSVSHAQSSYLLACVLGTARLFLVNVLSAAASPKSRSHLPNSPAVVFSNRRPAKTGRPRLILDAQNIDAADTHIRSANAFSRLTSLP